MAGWVRALLFLLGGVVAAGGTAYLTGLLDPWLSPPRPAVVSPVPQTSPSEPAAPQQKPAANAADDAGSKEAGQSEAPATTAKQDRIVSPDFDVLRVEPDGSVLVAGKAGAGAKVELLSDATVLGSTMAGEEGDFVIVLDKPLQPGDYRLTLRATTPGDAAVLSAGTAIVSVPQKKEGQVLAMIEEPGAPAQLLTVPQPEPAAPQGEPAPQIAAAKADGEPADKPADKVADKPSTEQSTSAPQEAASDRPASSEAAAGAGETATTTPGKPETPATPQPATAATVAVEAVEIEGDTIFVAGRATPRHAVRVYADALLLGEAAVSDGGRFLVEAKRDLAVGNYLIRADLIAKDGSVLARAAVPFEREPGEAIAAIAPPAPATSAAGEAAAPRPQAEEDARVAANDATVAPQGEGKLAAETPAGAGTAAAPAPAPAPAGGHEAATAPALQRADGAVIIRRGDSLWRISRRVYGHGIRYSTIYLANQRQISDPDRIWPGQVFTLPHETPEGDQADLDAIGDQAVEPQARQPTGN